MVGGNTEAPTNTGGTKTEQRAEQGPVPEARASCGAPTGEMGRARIARPAGATLAPNAGEAQEAILEVEVEVEEVICPSEDKVDPQDVFIARKRDEEWVVYEENHSSKAIQKRQRIVVVLVEQVKVC